MTQVLSNEELDTAICFAKSKWNSEADHMNQWCDMGGEEHCELSGRAVESAVLAKLAKGQEPVATVIKNGASRQWMSERLGKFPDGIYSLYTHPAPAQQPLIEAYEKGWREAAKWASREDLFCDIGSLAYLKDMAAHGIKEK